MNLHFVKYSKSKNRFPPTLLILFILTLGFGVLCDFKYHHFKSGVIEANQPKPKVTLTLTNAASADELLSHSKLKDYTTERNHNLADIGLPLGAPVFSIKNSKYPKTVYLTFDDGPGQYTRKIVDILNHNKIHGSFFWTGDNVDRWTNNSSNVKVIQAIIRDNHVIGSHTMHHQPMKHLSLSLQTEIIKNSTDDVSQKTGHSVYYFRPPDGSMDQNTLKASAANREILIYWNVDSEDWKYKDNPGKILNNIKRELKPGAIILMHEKPQTVSLLPKIISWLRNNGYEFKALPTPK